MADNLYVPQDFACNDIDMVDGSSVRVIVLKYIQMNIPNVCTFLSVWIQNIFEL